MGVLGPVDVKRQEFRKYLERVGVIDAFTKLLVLLYEETEKPEDALEYMWKVLGHANEDADEMEKLKKELEESKQQIAELEARIASLCNETEDTSK